MSAAKLKYNVVIGMKINKLEVVSGNEPMKNKGALSPFRTYNCICDCNPSIIHIRDANDLRKGLQSCGCLQATANLSISPGDVFNRLTAKKFIGNGMWEFDCSCNNKNVIKLGKSVSSGNTKSCGCLAEEARIKQTAAFNEAKKK